MSNDHAETLERLAQPLTCNLGSEGKAACLAGAAALAILREIVPFVRDNVTSCDGSRCREPNCADCCGAEAWKHVEAAREIALKAVGLVGKQE